ncbi:hypothetical protein UFOVP1288_29 [uncultured Caudovirales phage]|uniref:Uncharacterized protein n=1 Tax=uncultured Caudovirales phage TaxID=2100421 RepID=A0A6J5S7S0_9CAUD|nr:hypothetical protein UFOVP1195_29 [uncultured Caudovirales phage]CAB4195636.1 hypothetical protein UFOVP1288_29 [uncultured Caudovirales phage]CAB4204942.1 hypothetical protein UFOVP1409_29 [uncultured Caudovirales phage]
MPTDTPLDVLVAEYIVLRDTISEREAAHKAEIAELKEQQDVISNVLLDVCNEQHADSIKTAAGTVSRRVSSRYWTNDWEAMYAFISEHDAPFLLERRISHTMMRQFLEDNPDEAPMGLQAENKFTIQIRRPSAR